MRLLNYLFFALILVLNSCSFYQPSAEDKASDKIITQVADHLEKEYGMRLSALGGGADKGIWLITANFHIDRPFLDQQEARYLIVKAVEKFLEEVNNSEDIRPYLKNYPFTAQNLRIAIIIRFESENRKEPVDPYISTIGEPNGYVTYFTLNPENTYEFKTRIVEPYTEALAIVQQEEGLKNNTQQNAH